MRVQRLLLAALFSLISQTAIAQDLGHEYDGPVAPIRKGEKAIIPLDTGDPSYNAWRQLRDLSKDPKREPGVINVQK